MQLHTEKCQELVNAAMDRLHKGGRGYHKAVDASDAECASCPATIMEEALELLDRLDEYIDQTHAERDRPHVAASRGCARDDAGSCPPLCRMWRGADSRSEGG
jgi:hypothetical protein